MFIHQWFLWNKQILEPLTKQHTACPCEKSGCYILIPTSLNVCPLDLLSMPIAMEIAMYIVTICRQSLVIFRVVECLHVRGSGSHSSYIYMARGLLLQVHPFPGFLCTLLLYSWSLSKLVGMAQISLFILLGVLPDDSVHTRSHDQFFNLIG